MVPYSETENSSRGIYMIRIIVGKTYVDIREHTREFCSRPAAALEGRELVRSCPYLTHIVVIPIVSITPFRVPESSEPIMSSTSQRSPRRSMNAGRGRTHTPPLQTHKAALESSLSRTMRYSKPSINTATNHVGSRS